MKLLVRWCIFCLGLAASYSLVSAASADPLTIQIEVKAGEHARKNSPAKVWLLVPPADETAKATVAKITAPDGSTFWGQLAAPSLLSGGQVFDNGVPRELHFLVPELPAGKTAVYSVEIGGAEKPEGKSFLWQDNAGEYANLLYGDKPVSRYMYRAFDDSTAENRFLTYKVFHHLYDPAGKRIVTNGPDGHSEYTFKGIKYPHHRGIFYGFNKCSYEGVDRADLWHCQGDDYQGHAGFLSQEAGPLLGRHVVAIDWHGKGKKTFLKEKRELTFYEFPNGRLVEFASILSSEVGKVKLDGDPQHAGFQFRAHNDVATQTASQTYYIRTTGKGEPGKYLNWPANMDQVDFPWKGVSFVLGDQRYTCAYLDKPTNPKPARFSERDYARFGSYFATEVDTDKPLAVNYRLWFQEGEMTGEEIAALSNDFVSPPEVSVVRGK